jgi:tetratricopeptide (TPR) repeat protein
VGLKGALEKAGQLAPQDDRVFLGKARLAIQGGRWDEASTWLGRCREACADAPVWRAWLEWARGSGRPAEAIEAAWRLGPGRLDPEDSLELQAWLAQQRGDIDAESSALERWLRLEPTATRALERLAELAHRVGRPDRVAELRRRKAEVERSMEAYRDRLWSEEPLRTAAERAGLARLAEAAGRPHEARALYTWAIKADPGDPSAREGLARLDRADAQRANALSAEAEPWTEPESPIGPGRSDSGDRVGSVLAFTDDAEAVGLRFVYDNAETALHQLPEPFGGGLALLDYDGDGWLDVYCVQGGPFAGSSDNGSSPPGPGDRLFHNRRDGTFEDVTNDTGIGRFPRGHGHGVTVGDVDDDGHPDVFVTRWRSYALYRNRGDGTFEDVTDAWGLGGRRDWPTSAALADLDGDGDLDLYVCHYAAWDLANRRICRDTKTQAYLLHRDRLCPGTER